MVRKRIPPGTRLPVILTPRQQELIREHTFYDPSFGNLAVVDGKGIQVDLSLDDIEEIQGHVAAAANHSENQKLQRELDTLFKKLQKFLDTYDDQGS